MPDASLQAMLCLLASLLAFLQPRVFYDGEQGLGFVCFWSSVPSSGLGIGGARQMLKAFMYTRGLKGMHKQYTKECVPDGEIPGIES